MAAAAHVIDAGDGASALLACAVRAVADADGCPAVALGDSAGRATLARGGLRIASWASAPCGLLSFAVRPLARALRAACGGDAPGSVTCWSADLGRALAMVRCVRHATGRADVDAGRIDDAVAALTGAAAAERWAGHAHFVAMAPGCTSSSGEEALSRPAMRESIGASDGSVVVLGAADAPRCANTERMLDVAGRAMLAGADARLVLPECMPHVARAWRYARGLGLESRMHAVVGADWPVPWWRAVDAILVTDESPMVRSVAQAMGIPVVSAPGRPDDASSPGRRAAAAAARDAAAIALVSAAREPRQSAMNASAASA
jgi:hypothetical protein